MLLEWEFWAHQTPTHDEAGDSSSWDGIMYVFNTTDDGLRSSKLKISVFDENTARFNVLIGQGSIDLNDLLLEENTDIELEREITLYHKSYKDTPRGTVTLKFKYSPNRDFEEIQSQSVKLEEASKEKMKYVNVLLGPFQDRTEQENHEWVHIESRSLPSYFTLCHLVHLDLKEFMIKFFLGHRRYEDFFMSFISLIDNISFFLSYIPVGHIFSRTGRIIWLSCLEKFYIFSYVSVGIWTDRAVECFDLENLISIDDELDKKVRKEHQSSKTDNSAKNFNEADLDYDDDYVPTNSEGNAASSSVDDKNDKSGVIGDLIGPRAILLQIIPVLSIVSIYAISISSSPPYIASKKALKYFSPFLIRDSYDKAAEIEMVEGEYTLSAKERGVSWTIQLRAIAYFFNESRIIQYLVNSFSFMMTVGILYSSPVQFH